MKYSEYCFVGAQFDHAKGSNVHRMTIKQIDKSFDPYMVVYLHSENNEEIRVEWDYFERWIEQQIIIPIVTAMLNKKSNNCAIHERSFAVPKNKEVPEWLVNKAIDAGESWVRRNLRTWPYQKQLIHKINRVASEQSSREETFIIQWFWEEANES